MLEVWHRSVAKSVAQHICTAAFLGPSPGPAQGAGEECCWGSRSSCCNCVLLAQHMMRFNKSSFSCVPQALPVRRAPRRPRTQLTSPPLSTPCTRNAPDGWCPHTGRWSWWPCSRWVMRLEPWPSALSSPQARAGLRCSTWVRRLPSRFSGQSLILPAFGGLGLNHSCAVAL